MCIKIVEIRIENKKWGRSCGNEKSIYIFLVMKIMGRRAYLEYISWVCWDLSSKIAKLLHTRSTNSSRRVAREWCGVCLCFFFLYCCYGLKFCIVIPCNKVFPQFADGSVFESTYRVDGNGENFRYLFHVISGKGEVNDTFALRRQLPDGVD